MTATVLISGGARGIGRELARLYAQAGNHVIVGLRDPAKADELDFAVEAVPFDAADDASGRALGAAMAARTIDIVIANAGIYGSDEAFGSVPVETVREVFEVNTLGPLRTVQALLPALRRSSAGKIALISSGMGSMAIAKENGIAYRASKAAANKLFQGLATEVAPEGIAVVMLHPGWVRTDMGGSGADIAPGESAVGIKGMIEALTPATSGRFVDYMGQVIPW